MDVAVARGSRDDGCESETVVSEARTLALQALDEDAQGELGSQMEILTLDRWPMRVATVEPFSTSVTIAAWSPLEVICISERGQRPVDWHALQAKRRTIWESSADQQTSKIAFWCGCQRRRSFSRSQLAPFSTSRKSTTPSSELTAAICRPPTCLAPLEKATEKSGVKSRSG